MKKTPYFSLTIDLFSVGVGPWSANFKRWPAYLGVLRARKQQEEAEAAHAAEIAATHRQYAEKEELVIEQVHAQVEAAHLAASRLLQRNTMRRIDWLRFKWVWKHWQQIWHLATVKRDRASVEHLHATTVAVQRTRAERDRVAYEQKLREGEAVDAQCGLSVPLALLAARQAAAGVSPEVVGDFAAGLAAVPELKVESPDRDRSPGARGATKLGRVRNVTC